VVRGAVMNSFALGVAGVAAGVPAALTVTNLVRARLFGIGPGDPMALGLAGAIMLITTIFAGVLPALRAARVDPVRALRAD
jgi:ABC-type antimicrobial peptide transport system permease subunit